MSREIKLGDLKDRAGQLLRRAKRIVETHESVALGTAIRIARKELREDLLVLGHADYLLFGPAKLDIDHAIELAEGR